MWVFRYLDAIVIKTSGGERRLSSSEIERLGFSPEEALLPYPRNVFDGYRIIQEFFSFQERFYCFRINNLNRCWPESEEEEARIEFYFNRPMPSDIKVRQHDFSLYCIPAINLFKHTSEPIVLDGRRLMYPLIPSNKEKGGYEIFSVEEVSSSVNKQNGQKWRESGEVRIYPPFESFQHEIERQHGRKELYYRVTVKTSVDDNSLEQYLSFIRSDESHYIGRDETVSVDLMCTNGSLPEALGIGDINVLSQETPAFIGFTNITKPTQSYRPVLDGALQWTLISNMALNYLSMLETEPLKNILRTYDFPSLHDIQAQRRSKKRLDGIKAIRSKPLDMLIRGFPARGLLSVMDVDQDAFLCEGEIYLFGTVLSKFFALYSSINSFHQLEIHNLGNNENYLWTIEQGKQPVI